MGHFDAAACFFQGGLGVGHARTAPAQPEPGGIAQALVHDPDVLILDEPTDGLDPNQKHEMRELIRTLAPNKAIVVSTHILEEVEAICTRAIIIARGKLMADATPAEILARAPARDPAIQQLVRTTPLEDAFRHITLESAGS